MLDLRLVPAAAATWAVMWLIVAADWGLWPVAAASAVAAVVAIARRSLLVGVVAIVLAASALIGGVRTHQLAHNPVAVAADGSIADVEVVVANSRVAGNFGTGIVDATLRRIAVDGRSWETRLPILLTVSSGQATWLALPAGTRVAVRGSLAAADRADGVVAVVRCRGDPVVLAEPPWWQRAVEHVRMSLGQAMAGRPAEQAGLVPGLVVGDTTAMPAALAADFKTTALTHLTAVSGANLTIVLAFLSVLARWCGVRGRWLTVVAGVGVVLFVVLCHSEPSVLRASAMGLVGLAALGHGNGSGAGLRALCVAVMALCWLDPWMSHSIGFALSVLACVGIIGWGARWAEALTRWLPRWTAEAIAVPLAAQVATAPLVSWLSGAISVSGLAANAAAGPFVAPATVLGLVTALVAAVVPLAGTWLGVLAGWSAVPIVAIGHGFAQLPGASYPWPAGALGIAIVTVACLASIVVMPELLRRPLAVLVSASALVTVMLVPPIQPGWPPRDWTVVACDVGQGDAIVVRTGPGEGLMIDVGPPDMKVSSCLTQLGVRAIPLLVLTHPHADHTGALDEVLDRFPVGQILTGPLPGGDVVRSAATHDVPTRTAFEGDTVDVGDAHVTIVSIAQTAGVATDGEESSADNDASLIIRVDVDGTSLLATGDVEVAGQQTALRHADQLAVDILKVPHHGSSRQDPDFLAATNAKLGIISVGADNTYGHPADKTITALGRDGMMVVRTDEHGSIAVTQDTSLSVVTQR